MAFVSPKLYAITDVSIAGLSHLEQLKRLIEGGATLIQLREKTVAPGEWFEDALACAEYARKHGVMLIVNDRLDIAMAIGANGVHLGQDDMPVGAARELLGRDAVIGLSTHTLEQLEAAARLPIDYIGFGPIFPTATKSNPDEVVGLELLNEARRIAPDLPIVAIGGITLDNFQGVLDAGATSVAIIRDLLSDAKAISHKVRTFDYECC